jgi:hypothetical protein
VFAAGAGGTRTKFKTDGTKTHGSSTRQPRRIPRSPYLHPAATRCSATRWPLDTKTIAGLPCDSILAEDKLMNLILLIIILLLLFGGGGGYYYGGPAVGGGIGGLLLVVLIVYLLMGRR